MNLLGTVQRLLLGATLAALSVSGVAEAGATVEYRLPADDPLPHTYLVTLAITDADNPDWVVSTFVAGQPRTVTVANAGRFTETWDGLDENFMPVPPGEYGVRGIFSRAEIWPVDGEWHAITARYSMGFSPWLPSPDTREYWKIPIPFGGDPVGAPFRDVDVGPNGVAVFYYQYLENGKNCPMFDLNRPFGPEQFLQAFRSGGAAGGPCVATDGEAVWAYAEEGGPDFVYRADGKPFGKDNGAHRRGVTIPEGKVTAITAWRDPDTRKSFVYVVERGKIVNTPPERGREYGRGVESEDLLINRVTVMDGGDANVLTSIALPGPKGIAARNGKLFALHGGKGRWTVSSVALSRGLPGGGWKTVLSVPDSIEPSDLEIDRTGRLYLADPSANRVYQFDAKGAPLRTYGRLDAQKPGAYDPETFMSPTKLATWTDAEGHDRLIVCEHVGPNRASEWSADDGRFLREFLPYQTKANSGYAFDPDDPQLLYLPTHGNWLTRFKLDYVKHTWRIDAVWPNVEAGQRRGLDKPVAIRANGTLYLASEQSTVVYRLSAAGDRWLRSAGVVRRDKDAFLWNDANGNGEVDDEELRSTELPGHVLTYHGQKWLPDVSYLAMAQHGRDLWRLAPSSFDSHGNPVFTEWQKVLTDPIFAARVAGTADAVHGGNELAETFSSDWMQADGAVKDGFYIQARGGRNFTANYGAQHKVSRYVPDKEGGYSLKWRVGRTKLGQAAHRGELEGGMRLFRPINGLLTVIDQSRSGLFIYTEDGLYVDTLFPPGHTRDEIGVYRQPGEFFAGTVYANPRNGKVYYAAGKYTPMLYEMHGWSLNENPVRKLSVKTRRVTIKSAEIADPPELAIALRGGAGATSVARFLPAVGGVTLDGSMSGWTAAEPVTFGASTDRSVEVRCLYDPEHLHLRWHVRLGSDVRIQPLPPLERIFTHDQQSDTVGFYIQGDVDAPAPRSREGRPGDVRMVFGLFEKDGGTIPVAVGLYPSWEGADGRPQTYGTLVGRASFEHVGAIAGADLGHAIDDDGKGFVIAASIPRSAIPSIGEPFSGTSRTQVNFDANLGGHNKFWWANADGSANCDTYDEPTEAHFYPRSWAPALFEGITEGVPAREWSILGPFGGDGAEKFTADPRNKSEVRRFFEAAIYPPDDGVVNPAAVFEGAMIRGYWRNPARIRWKSATIAALDTRVVLGLGSQVWYGSTWIHAPEERPVEFEFQGHRMTHVRWSLNDQAIQVPEKSYEDEGRLNRQTASRDVVLKAGWNHVLFRAYNVGYVPFRLGLVVRAPPATLWQLRLADQPGR